MLPWGLWREDSRLITSLEQFQCLHHTNTSIHSCTDYTFFAAQQCSVVGQSHDEVLIGDHPCSDGLGVRVFGCTEAALVHAGTATQGS
jgi:hypothetical protein